MASIKNKIAKSAERRARIKAANALRRPLAGDRPVKRRPEPGVILQLLGLAKSPKSKGGAAFRPRFW